MRPLKLSSKSPLLFALLTAALLLAAPILSVSAAEAQEQSKDTLFETSRNYLRVEGGATSLAYNTVQYPDNSSGTRYSLRPLLGTGDKAFGLLTYERTLDKVHGLRFVYAPLKDTGTGELQEPIQYRGKAFAAGVPTKATYQFTGYRATYWWRLEKTRKLEARIGATLNIRDARIDISQAGVSDRYANVGPVPLAYLYLKYQLTPGLNFCADADAFDVPGGRAIDANIRLERPLTSQIDFLLGLRTLEGEAEQSNSIYNDIRYNYATIGLGFKL
jgi:hypothetical protein